MSTVSSTGEMKIFPSPFEPVLAASFIAVTTSSIFVSSTTANNVSKGVNSATRTPVPLPLCIARRCPLPLPRD